MILQAVDHLLGTAENAKEYKSLLPEYTKLADLLVADVDEGKKR